MQIGEGIHILIIVKICDYFVYVDGCQIKSQIFNKTDLLFHKIYYILDESSWADPEGAARGNRSGQVAIGFLRNIGKDPPTL